MGHEIDDVLAILSEIRQLFDGDQRGRGMVELRREATGLVAHRSDRTTTTLHDALTRRLNLRAAHFDQLLEDWLIRDKPGLYNHLYDHATGNTDREAINRFFNSTLPIEPIMPPPVPPKPPLSVKLDEDVAQVFRTSKAVNDTLRAVIRLARNMDPSDRTE